MHVVMLLLLLSWLAGCRYVGRLKSNGKVFDKTDKKPFAFRLGESYLVVTVLICFFVLIQPVGTVSGGLVTTPLQHRVPAKAKQEPACSPD